MNSLSLSKVKRLISGGIDILLLQSVIIKFKEETVM